MSHESKFKEAEIYYEDAMYAFNHKDFGFAVGYLKKAYLELKEEMENLKKNIEFMTGQHENEIEELTKRRDECAKGVIDGTKENIELKKTLSSIRSEIDTIETWFNNLKKYEKISKGAIESMEKNLESLKAGKK